jgi:hypothetical protein
VAGDVRQRLAGGSPGDERFVRRLEFRRRRLARAGEQPCGIPAEQVLSEQTGVEICRGCDAGVAESIACDRDDFADCFQETAVASFSFSDW